jgi:hypothetical protein
MYDCYHDEFRYLNVFHHIVIGYVEDKHLPSLSNEYAPCDVVFFIFCLIFFVDNFVCFSPFL